MLAPSLHTDVSVDLSIVATFTAKANSIETTLRLSWDADSTWCQVESALVGTPIAAILVSKLAQGRQATLSSAQLGPAPFHEIGRDDSSITYRQEMILPVPAPLVATASTFNAEGCMISGGLIFARRGLGLQGWVQPAISDISLNCTEGRVTVQFHPPMVGVLDHDPPGGAPRVFPRRWYCPPMPGLCRRVPETTGSRHSLRLLLRPADDCRLEHKPPSFCQLTAECAGYMA